MTINEEGRALRSEVSKLRPDKRRRYGEELIQRILAWVASATANGMSEPKCGEVLGIKAWRFRMWRARNPLPAPPVDEALALVPITVTTPFARPTLVTPSGYRVEGLGIAELAALLRELA